MHAMKSLTVGILNLICAFLSSFSAEYNTSPLSCFNNFKPLSYIEMIRVVFRMADIYAIVMLLCIITSYNNYAEFLSTHLLFVLN